jgi:purine-binding chemotaxis protein CheW
MPGIAVDISSRPWLFCRAGSRLCALALGDIIEISRLLPVEPLARSPPFVLGLTVLRGTPTPVIDAGSLFGDQTLAPERLVAVKAGDRTVALAFTAVTGLRAIGADVLAKLPPLLGEAAAEVVTTVAALDAELLHVLDAARMASDAVLEGHADTGAFW